MKQACLTALLLASAPTMLPADTLRSGSSTLRIMPMQTDTLDNLQWQARPVVVLGTGPEVEAQLDALRTETTELVKRQVVVLTEGPGAADLRDRVGSGFAVLLIGKDGSVKLSQTTLVDPSQIIGLIDTMPMRQRETGS
ncbi:DUF4174 domain-containing protein [Paracoccus sp. JM45]|uniref:DUF4174 domain-containing protein n=1 Tax=Paracoccus sp. JM45 TaxID=2283626 RepID=UPI001601607A|nr:DUF4174 domain-containing protein [Paracoccus sp. JM45]